MIKGKKILAVIPARIGSKGLKKKNIKVFNGHPLIAWTIASAKQSRLIDDIIVSSDSKLILDKSKNYINDYLYLRPKKLGKDNIKNSNVCLDAYIHMFETYKKNYDYILLLQPTVPFRLNNEIDKAIKKFYSNKYDYLISIKEQDYPPWWMFGLHGEKLKPIFNFKNKEVFKLRRQDFGKTYRPSGSLYITKVKNLIKNKIMTSSTNCGYYKVDFKSSFNIDDINHFKLAESFAKENNSKLNFK